MLINVHRLSSYSQACSILMYYKFSLLCMIKNFFPGTQIKDIGINGFFEDCYEPLGASQLIFRLVFDLLDPTSKKGFQ